MPRLSEIPRSGLQDIPLSRVKWLQQIVRFVEGGTYLLAGEPGIGKTTLALQIAVDVANQGRKVLYLTNEQSPADLKATVLRLVGNVQTVPPQLDENLFIEPLARLDDLEFWHNHIFEEQGQYGNTKFVVIDSIQGGGVAPTARKAYQELVRFTRFTKNKGVSSLLVAHVTKAGTIAGPKDIEHHVDCILQYRKAFKLRPLFVPKHRFGPAWLEPYVLEMSDAGLIPSPHAVPKIASVCAIPFDTLQIAEFQARVQVPRWGDRPGLRAPYLPSQKISHLIDAITQIPEIDVSDLIYQISCYMPGSYTRYDFGCDLAIVISILSSYLQQEVPPNIGFYGEVDLNGAVRSATRMDEGQTIRDLIEDIKSATEPSVEKEEEEEEEIRAAVIDAEKAFIGKLKKLERIFVPKEVSENIKHALEESGLSTECVGVAFIQDVVSQLWPHLSSTSP